MAIGRLAPQKTSSGEGEDHCGRGASASWRSRLHVLRLRRASTRQNPRTRSRITAHMNSPPISTERLRMLPNAFAAQRLLFTARYFFRRSGLWIRPSRRTRGDQHRLGDSRQKPGRVRQFLQKSAFEERRPLHAESQWCRSSYLERRLLARWRNSVCLKYGLLIGGDRK